MFSFVGNSMHLTSPYHIFLACVFSPPPASFFALCSSFCLNCKYWIPLGILPGFLYNAAVWNQIGLIIIRLLAVWSCFLIVVGMINACHVLKPMVGSQQMSIIIFIHIFFLSNLVCFWDNSFYVYCTNLCLPVLVFRATCLLYSIPFSASKTASEVWFFFRCQSISSPKFSFFPHY